MKYFTNFMLCPERFYPTYLQLNGTHRIDAAIKKVAHALEYKAYMQEWTLCDYRKTYDWSIYGKENFTKEDINAFIDLVKEELQLGQ